MSERKYLLTITRSEPNPIYEPDRNKRTYINENQPPIIETREVSASIDETEFNTIKQALIKVWS